MALRCASSRGFTGPVPFIGATLAIPLVPARAPPKWPRDDDIFLPLPLNRVEERLMLCIALDPINQGENGNGQEPPRQSTPPRRRDTEYPR